MLGDDPLLRRPGNHGKIKNDLRAGEGGRRMEAARVVHPIEPVYDQDSRVLILGSFPSVKSRDRVVNKSEKASLYAAMDLASVWLERALARG